MSMPRNVVTGLERWPVTVSDSSGAGIGMVNCVRAGSLGAVRLKACAWAVLIAEPVSRANTAAVVTFFILLYLACLFTAILLCGDIAWIVCNRDMLAG